MMKKLRPDSERIHTTDRLLPLGSLRRKCVRKIFSGWISECFYEGRVITSTLAKEVVVRLRRKFGLDTDDLEDVEIKAEIKRMHALLKTARKHRLGTAQSKRSAMSSMDLCDTLPMDLEESGVEDPSCDV